MEEILFTKEQINEICVRLGKQLDERFKDNKEAPVFVCVLKGAANFFINLISNTHFEMITDYIQVSSYKGNESTGIINMKKDFEQDLTGKDVVIVEDIIDTGLTLSYVKKYLQETKHPKSITFVCLIDKKPLRKTDLVADYVGVEMSENKFVCGFGLDYNEYFRNVDCIFIPDKKELEGK